MAQEIRKIQNTIYNICLINYDDLWNSVKLQVAEDVTNYAIIIGSTDHRNILITRFAEKLCTLKDDKYITPCIILNETNNNTIILLVLKVLGIPVYYKNWDILYSDQANEQRQMYNEIRTQIQSLQRKTKFAVKRKLNNK